MNRSRLFHNLHLLSNHPCHRHSYHFSGVSSNQLAHTSTIAKAQRVGLNFEVKKLNSTRKLAVKAANDANLLKESNIDGQFTGIESTGDAQKNNYFLMFESSKYTSSFELFISGGEVYAMVEISCTNSGCASEHFGCTPDVTGSACRECSNGVACTKTVSNSQLF